MATTETVGKIKTALRIRHDKLDGDVADMIDACLADLEICGIVQPDEADAIILSAIKLYCRANFEDDTQRAADFQKRYDALKGCLMVASGYGGDGGNGGGPSVN